MGLGMEARSGCSTSGSCLHHQLELLQKPQRVPCFSEQGNSAAGRNKGTGQEVALYGLKWVKQHGDSRERRWGACLTPRRLVMGSFWPGRVPRH